MRKLMKAGEAAALLGVSRQALNQARQAGRIHYADEAARLYDPAALEASWHANRQRKRTPKARPDGAVPAEHVDSVPVLARRKLKAEVSILERKAATGPEGMVHRAAVERALFLFYTMGRTVADSLQPKLMDQTDRFCPPGHPDYAQLYANFHAILRNTWVDIWVELAQSCATECPDLKAFFISFAQQERGRGKGNA